MNRRLPTRVTLRNYKSIAACDVSPAPLSFLVGPNGSGKSNFLDALRFVADALRSSLGDALSERGGIGEVLHRLDRRGGGTWKFSRCAQDDPGEARQHSQRKQLRPFRAR